MNNNTTRYSDINVIESARTKSLKGLGNVQLVYIKFQSWSRDGIIDRMHVITLSYSLESDSLQGISFMV